MRYLANVVTLTYHEAKCTGCGRCVEVCPHGVFRIDGKKAKMVDKDACIECGACMNNCAFNAISVKAGVGCASAMIDGLLKYGDPDRGTCDCSGDGGCC
ncbi:MAG: 4Fe-4S dicluster domain-containing protein [Chitinivibrionales bacterium]|nr:4Fe-4S dicluster domain-containing protein [Chitinivibrionales bacterium]MBD3357810.1 4Fe-4S dicluster domain-containing protein [Chitinivibrionales bacterium]